MIRSILLWVAISIPVASQAIEIKTLGTTYGENFDSLASSGTSATVPLSWRISESGTSARVDQNYTAGTGSDNTADLYSYGTESSERALGSLSSGTLDPAYSVLLHNVSGQDIARLTIEYVGERWRLGTLNRQDRLNFAYSFNDASWTSLSSLDFVAPSSNGPFGANNGNDNANRWLISGDISGLKLVSGASLWLKWTDSDASGADDGLAIDDFAITAYGNAPSSTVPESLPVGFGPAVLALLTIISHRTRRSAS